MMKTLRVIGIVVIVVSLILAGTGSVFAHNDPTLSQIRGKITLEDDKITITPEDGEPVTLVITDDTTVNKDGKPATIDDLEEGQTVMAFYDPDTNEAVKIMILSPKPEGLPAYRPQWWPDGPWFVADGHAIFGTVESIDEDSDGGAVITLLTKEGDTIEVTVTDETKYGPMRYWVHPQEVTTEVEDGKLIVSAVIAEIEEGDRLVVWAVETDGTFTARWVVVIPDRPTHCHISGVITEVSDNTITVVDGEGNTFTIDLPEGFNGFEVGQFVTLTIDGVSEAGHYIAKAVCPFDKLRERLNRFIDGCTNQLDKLELTHEGRPIMQNINRLSMLLEWNMGTHEGLLEELLESRRLTDQVSYKIENSLRVSSSRRGAALEALSQHMEEVKARWEAKGGRWEVMWEGGK